MDFSVHLNYNGDYQIKCRKKRTIHTRNKSVKVSKSHGICAENIKWFSMFKCLNRI